MGARLTHVSCFAFVVWQEDIINAPKRVRNQRRRALEELVEHTAKNARMRSNLLEQIQRDEDGDLKQRGDDGFHRLGQNLAMQLVSFLKQQPLTLDSTCSFKVNSDMPLSLRLEKDLRRTGLCWHYSGESESRVLHLCPMGWWSLVLRPLDRDVIETHILPRVGGAAGNDSIFRRWTERRRKRLKWSIEGQILNWEMRVKLLERLERVPHGSLADELFTELEQEPVTLDSICSIKLGYQTPLEQALMSKLEGSSLWRYSTGPESSREHAPMFKFEGSSLYSPESSRVLHIMPRGWWALLLEPLDRDVIETHILPTAGVRTPVRSMERAEEEGIAFRLWTERHREQLKSLVKSQILKSEICANLLERVEQAPDKAFETSLRYERFRNELFVQAVTLLEQEPVTLSSICNFKLNGRGYQTPLKHALMSKLEGSSLWRYSTGPESSRVLHIMPRGWWALVLEPLDRDILETHILPRIQCPGPTMA